MLLEYPIFYPDFACIGKACKDSCCRDWLIDIDEDTAKKYQALAGALGEKLRKKLQEKDGEFYFAVEKEGNCPFLQEDGLCEIQRQRGEEELSKVCDAYPRREYSVSPYTQLDLHLSCEEAVIAILSWEGDLIREDLEDEAEEGEEAEVEVGEEAEVEVGEEAGVKSGGKNRKVTEEDADKQELLVSLLAFRQSLWMALPDFPKDINSFFAELKTVFLQGEALLFYENKDFPYKEELAALEEGLTEEVFSEKSFWEYRNRSMEVQGRGRQWKSFLDILQRAEEDLLLKSKTHYEKRDFPSLVSLCCYYIFRYILKGIEKNTILPLFYLIRNSILWMGYTEVLLGYFAKEEEKKLFFYGEEESFRRIAVFFSKEVEHQEKNLELFWK